MSFVAFATWQGPLSVARAQAEPTRVHVELEPFLVTEVTLEDGTVEERLEPAERAFPGQVIEYRVRVEHQGEEELPAGDVVVTVPVPEGTAYEPGSAATAAGAWRLEFSPPESEAFAEPPVTRTVTNEAGEEEVVVVEPAEYDAVRWVLLTSLEPGGVRTLTYRVRIDD